MVTVPGTLFMLYSRLILFTTHTASGCFIWRWCPGFCSHSHVQQLFLPQSTESLFSVLHLWMSSSGLPLSSSKTQLIWFGTRHQLLKLHFNFLAEWFPYFNFSISVCNSSVAFDSTLSFSEHISHLTRISYYHQWHPPVTRFCFLFHLHVNGSWFCLFMHWLLQLATSQPTQILLLSTSYGAEHSCPSHLIACHPHYSYIFTFMSEQLHWLTLYDALGSRPNEPLWLHSAT